MGGKGARSPRCPKSTDDQSLNRFGQTKTVGRPAGKTCMGVLRDAAAAGCQNGCLLRRLRIHSLVTVAPEPIRSTLRRRFAGRWEPGSVVAVEGRISDRGAQVGLREPPKRCWTL